MFTTAAQLLDLTDKKLLLVLRDGRKLIGVLRSWDQFANLVLQDTIERTFYHPSSSSTTPQYLYTDIPRGIFLVRGENVLLLGEIDLDRDDFVPEPWRRIGAEEAGGIKKSGDGREKARARLLGGLGFEVEAAGEVLF
jgi:U6 snRNA-associated Sm-like protein LSm1